MNTDASFYVVLVFLSLLLTGFIGSSSVAYAQEDTLQEDTLSEIPKEHIDYDSEKIQGYLQEARNAHTECNLQPDYARAYDCECVAGKFFDVRVESGDALAYNDIFLDTLPLCKSSATLANYYYQHCISWSASSRPDADEFCECYGNAIGRSFEYKTFSTGKQTEAVMKYALKECNFRTPLEKEKNRQKTIEKEKSLYERLFSSSREEK